MFSLGLGKRRLEQQLAKRDQRIAELEQQQREQAAKRDQRIAELEQQQREQTAKRDQRIAELEQQLQEQATKRDQRIAELEQQAQQLLRELEEWRRGHRRRGKRYPARKKPASEKKRPGREPGHPGAGRPLPTLTAEDLALGYKQLLRVEQCWRTMKSGLRMRPVYHWTERRIRAHVLLCVLALLLERVAEIRSGDTWRNVAAKLETIKVVEYQRAQTRVRQTTEVRSDVQALLNKLRVPMPPKLHLIEPTPSAQSPPSA